MGAGNRIWPNLGPAERRAHGKHTIGRGLWGPGEQALGRGSLPSSCGGGKGAGRDWEQEEKGTTEDEMAGWHH